VFSGKGQVIKGRLSQQTQTQSESAGKLEFRSPVGEQARDRWADTPALTERGNLARVVKRSFDVVISLLALAVLSPLLLLIALLVKADSPGPILFRSLRVGRNGEALWMLKFRTMVEGADAQRDALRHLSDASGGLFKIENDPRVTRLGRYLRRTSLDEIPQLFQVLTGKMSLVGPRPLPPEEDALIDRGGWRLHVRPGITGPWQVAGSWRVDLAEMVLLDDDYLANWSVWRDLKILVFTLGHVVQRRGA
jgi:lipopolysaccharide/colanic/teichoic acid biosynthesis glycosyltransferase